MVEAFLAFLAAPFHAPARKDAQLLRAQAQLRRKADSSRPASAAGKGAVLCELLGLEEGARLVVRVRVVRLFSVGAGEARV
eukprot:2860613-Pleurochrysis_carterae.AAC.2